jgi:hypothetical protein
MANIETLLADTRYFVDQGSDPTAPSAGNAILYTKSGDLYVRDSAAIVGPLLDETAHDLLDHTGLTGVGGGTPIGSGYRGLILAEPSLVSYWEFDDDSGASGTAIDSAGTNHLTATAKGVNFRRPGAFAASRCVGMSFGTLQKTSPTGLPTGSAARTIELWWRAGGHNAGSLQDIVGYGTNATRQLCGLRANGNGADAAGLIFWSDDQSEATAGVLDGFWHHFALTYASGATQAKFYLDGRLLFTRTLGGALNTTLSANGIIIGRQVWTTSGWVFGGVDEVAIYSAELSATTIEDHYLAAFE